METQTIIDNTQIWLEEAVIGLNLCPFAGFPFRKKTIRYVVEESSEVDNMLRSFKSEMDLLIATPSTQIETTLLILPNGFADFLDFNDFLYTANEALIAADYEGELQVASFHPAYQFAGTEEADVENYTNRAPFPILHLLREDSVEEAIESYENTDDIYLNNIKTMETLGREGIKQLWHKFTNR